MLNYKYILDGKIVIQCDDLHTWATWMETNSRHVADEEIGGIRISTVFLGLDHNFGGKGDPKLFETAVFYPDEGMRMQTRYFTWGEAEEGHREIVEMIKEQTMNADYAAMDVMRELMKTEK